MTRVLVETARKAAILLRQSYVRVTNRLLFQQSQYARARQMNRARRYQKKLHTILGRLTRDISRKLTQCASEKTRDYVESLLEQSNRLLNQTQSRSEKLYSIHEPHVEYIAKGKSHKHYEFGNKVSLVVTNRRSWIVGVQALHGNPYDGIL